MQCYQSISGSVAPRISGDCFLERLGYNLPTDVNVLLKMQGLLCKYSAHSPSMVSTFLSISEINEEGWQKDKRDVKRGR